MLSKMSCKVCFLLSATHFSVRRCVDAGGSGEIFDQDPDAACASFLYDSLLIVSFHIILPFLPQPKNRFQLFPHPWLPAASECIIPVTWVMQF